LAGPDREVTIRQLGQRPPESGHTSEMNRVRHMVIALKNPVLLTGLDLPVLPGRYEVTTEEEPVGDLMYPAYRRISAVIYLPQVPGRIGVGQNMELSGPELEMLLDSVEQSQ
jgi:hypothetical protein